MPKPATPELVAAAEREIGFELPPDLRERLVTENGGELQVAGYPGDPGWQVIPVLDDRDRSSLRRTAVTNLASGTRALRADGLITGEEAWIADNGTGDLLLARADGTYVWRDHETEERHPVELDLGTGRS